MAPSTIMKMRLLFTASGLAFFSLTNLTCGNRTTTQELLDANFLASGQAKIDLLSPTENQQVTTANPTLSWSSRGANLYTLEMATDSRFSAIVLKKDVNGTTYTVANSDLSGVSSLGTATYYWRVKIAKVTQNLQSRTGTFFLFETPAGGSGYAGALYVNAASTVETEVGSKEAPYTKILSAIAAADVLRKGVKAISVDVLVAKGTYTEEINLVSGISIRGGYEAANWTRDISVNVTSITAPSDIAVRANSTVPGTYTATTAVEGFTITGGTVPYCYGFYLVQGNPLIKNNIINGGSGSDHSYGIYISQASPQIINNSITGGSNANYNHGIWMNDTGSPEMSGNTIFGGSTGNESYALVSNGSPRIFNNLILGGSSAFSAYGVRNHGGTPVIYNNTISGGYGGGLVGGIIFVGANSAIVRNNIFFTSAGSNRYCAQVNSGGTDKPAAFENNNLFDCPDAFYKDGGSNITNMGVTNITTSAGTNTLTGFGNVNINNTSNQLLVLVNGADANIATMTDNDWHLATNAAVCNVRFGGVNLSGSLTTDKDNLTRTASITSLPCTLTAPSNTAGQGWSIGAYESN